VLQQQDAAMQKVLFLGQDFLTTPTPVHMVYSWRFESVILVCNMGMIKALDPCEYTGQAVVIFTYDDGLLSHFQLAAPLHLKYNIPATFAVIANRVVDSSFWARHLNPLQVLQLNEMGFEIASHGHQHDIAYGEMTDDAIDSDASMSRHIFGFLLEKKVSSICVPFSSYGKRIGHIVEQYYDHIRIRGERTVDILNNGRLNHAFGMEMATNLDEAKRQIKQAIESRTGVILTFHGITEGEAKGKHEVSKAFLDDMLEYVASFDRQQLLPIRLGDVSAIRALHDQTTPKTSTESIDNVDPRHPVPPEISE
jgi:peptidoglycan/xylan/chitin deacetylase (PgdA/CDA1 family)